MTLAVAATPPPLARRRPVRRGWRSRYPGDFPTLGWQVLGWTYAHLPSPADEHSPFVYTDEQARRVLRIYEIDPRTGTRLYRRVHEEEAKGWGKGPFAASIALAEFRGPVCFDGWDAEGQPVGVPWGTHGRPSPWVQIAAVSEDQTYNTWRAVYAFLTDNDHRAARDLRIDEGRTRLYAMDMPSAFMERVTASAGSREGQPITHDVLDEPQLWTPANQGDQLARTILRNLTKTGGWAHFTGNAPVVGLGSVSELYGEPAAGALHFATRPSEVPQQDWTREKKRAALEEVYRDVAWISRERVLEDMEDPAQPWPDSLRFFFNTRTDAKTFGWIPAAIWNDRVADVALRAEVPTYAVVTIAHDHRSAAVAAAQRHGSTIALQVRMFPSETLPDGEFVAVADVAQHLRGLHAGYPAKVVVPTRVGGQQRLVTAQGPEIVYHGAFFEGSVQELRREGLVFLDIPDSQEQLAPASESLKAAALEARLIHEDDPVLARQIAAVQAVESAKGWTVQVAGPAARAAMVAVHRAVTAPDPARVFKPATFRSY